MVYLFCYVYFENEILFWVSFQLHFKRLYFDKSFGSFSWSQNVRTYERKFINKLFVNFTVQNQSISVSLYTEHTFLRFVRSFYLFNVEFHLNAPHAIASSSALRYGVWDYYKPMR